MKFLAAVVGGLIGGVVGYFIGAYVSCDWLYPTSNLCGIYGFLATGPIGLVGGAIAGWRLSRSSARPAD